MPIDPSKYQAPKDPIRLLLPDDIYIVEITDIDVTVQPSSFKPDEMNQQVQLDLKVLEGKYEGAEFREWVKDSLAPANKKTKRPKAILSVLLETVFGRPFTAQDRGTVTPEFLNTLIGAKLRVMLQQEKSEAGVDRNKVVSFSKVTTE